MQVKEPTFSVSNMFTFNSQQYFKYFDFNIYTQPHVERVNIKEFIDRKSEACDIFLKVY